MPVPKVVPLCVFRDDHGIKRHEESRLERPHSVNPRLECQPKTRANPSGTVIAGNHVSYKRSTLETQNTRHSTLYKGFQANKIVLKFYTSIQGCTYLFRKTNDVIQKNKTLSVQKAVSFHLRWVSNSSFPSAQNVLLQPITYRDPASRSLNPASCG